MDRARGAVAVGFVQAVPQRAAVTGAEQRSISEVRKTLTELHAFLARYWNRADPARYAHDRDELLVPTAAYGCTTPACRALEALLAEAKRYQGVFAKVLGRALEAQSQRRS